MKTKKEIKAVFVIFISTDYRFILCTENGYSNGLYKCFGGKVENYETCDYAIAREVMQEASLVDLPFKKLFVFEKEDHCVGFYIAMRLIDPSNIRIDKKEIKSFKLFSRKELEKEIAWNGVLECHSEALKKILNLIPY